LIRKKRSEIRETKRLVIKIKSKTTFAESGFNRGIFVIGQIRESPILHGLILEKAIFTILVQTTRVLKENQPRITSKE